jgi:hypothetical protein
VRDPLGDALGQLAAGDVPDREQQVGQPAREVAVRRRGGHPDARRQPVQPDGGLAAGPGRGHRSTDQRRAQVTVVVALLAGHPRGVCPTC